MPNSPQQHRATLFLFANKSDWPYAIVGTVLMTLASLGSPIQTYIYGKTFLKLSKYLLGSYGSGSEFLNEVRVLCLIIMAVGLGRLFLTWFSVLAWLIVGERNQRRARKLIFKLLLRKELSWFDTKENLMGELSQVNRNVEEIRAGISENLAMLVEVISSAGFLLINAMRSLWSLTLMVMASMPLMALSTFVFGSQTYKFQKRENECGSKASKVLDWSFLNGDLVRLLNGKYADMVKFNRIVEQSARAFYRMALAIAGNSSVLRLLSNMIFVQGFLFGAYLMLINQLKIDQLFTAFSSCLLLGVQISQIADIIALLNKAKAAAYTILSSDMINSKEKTALANTVEFVEKPNLNSITLDNVSFQYQASDSAVLNNVNARFSSSHLNFVIGESGSGKSTLVLLLMNFYPLTDGTIYFGTSPLTSLTEEQIFESVSLVEPDPVVFEGLIYDNLQLSEEGIPEDTIRKACSFARLGEFVDSQPQGIFTPLQPSALSGGQKQRLGLARAWIKNSPVLILDESLSAIDAGTRRALLEDIRDWRRNKLTIYITHNSLEIRKDDVVLALDRGLARYQKTGHDIMKTNISVPKSPVEKRFSKLESIFSTKKARVRFSIYDHLHNPVILHDLEEKGQKEDVGSLAMLGLFAIVRFCFSTIYSRTHMVFGLVLSLLNGFATPSISYCVSKLLSTAIDVSYATGSFSHEMLTWSLIVTGIALGDSIMYFISQALLQYSLERWIVSLRENTMALIDEQDMTFFNGQGHRPAELSALLMNDSRDLRNLISEFLSAVLLLIALTLLGVIWATILGWKLALVGIAFVPLTIIVTIIYGMTLSKLETSYKDHVAVAENFVHSAVTGIRTVRSFGMESRMRNEYEKRLQALRVVGNWRACSTGLGVAILDLCTCVATGTILYYGMSLVAANNYTYAQLMEVMTLLTFTMASASSLMHKLPEVTRGKRAGLRLFWLSKMEKLLIETLGTLQIHSARGVSHIIKLKNVDFSFPDKATSSYKRVLRDASLDIGMGQTIALVGKSGSGKSTLALLLGRLYEHDRGTISYLDRNLIDLNVDWYRSQVVVVPQHPRFFEGSILDNLTYGLPKSEINFDKIWRRLEQCNVSEFVRSLPDGINSVLGEGSNVQASMGQMQRLGICRGLVREPKVLVLDECTSNLDETNSAFIADLICKNLREEFPQLTIIFITHEINIMKAASRVVMLSGGRIVDDGTYDWLYLKKGEFYNLVK